MISNNGQSIWTLVWSDEFDKAEIDSTKWTYDIGNGFTNYDGTYVVGWGNGEKQYYVNSDKNTYIKNGKLHITAIKEKYKDFEYTSARLKTEGLFSKKYGRFEIRAKLPVGKGIWPAFWLMPKDNVYGPWPISGEIDILELRGSDPTYVSGTLHLGKIFPHNTWIAKRYYFKDGQTVEDYHTYVLEWEPGEMRWYVDGELYSVQNRWYSKGLYSKKNYKYPQPFDQPFYMIINLAVGGFYDGDPDETTKFPQTMEIDYIRVYELKGKEYKKAIEPKKVIDKIPKNAKKPLNDGNMIYNNNYDMYTDEKNSNLLHWNFLSLDKFKGNAKLLIEDINQKKYAKIEIVDYGIHFDAIQLNQTVSLVKGHRYKASFDACTMGTRDIYVKFSGGATRDFASYSNFEKFTLNNQIEHYEFTFELWHDTDIEAAYVFALGGVNSTGAVWIGNVRLEEIE